MNIERTFGTNVNVYLELLVLMLMLGMLRTSCINVEIPFLSLYSRFLEFESESGFKMFFYCLRLVLDSVLFGLSHWTHQIFYLVLTESSTICFCSKVASSLKTKPLMKRARSDNRY